MAWASTISRTNWFQKSPSVVLASVAAGTDGGLDKLGDGLLVMGAGAGCSSATGCCGFGTTTRSELSAWRTGAANSGVFFSAGAEAIGLALTA